VAEIIERLRAALEQAERSLHRRLPPPLLVGYSNGGFFTSLLRSAELDLPATGFALLHAGAVTGVTFSSRPRPTLLIAAEGDTIQRPTMQALRAQLEQAGWSPAWVLRKKEHPLELEDFEHVMSFARRLSWKAPP
jgi:predicted esterase